METHHVVYLFCMPKYNASLNCLKTLTKPGVNQRQALSNHLFSVLQG